MSGLGAGPRILVSGLGAEPRTVLSGLGAVLYTLVSGLGAGSTYFSEWAQCWGHVH